ncbi:FecR family protein [Pedobacter sp. MC2016-14]|uniref:FecR family protein n=1 Tax=Pedobacter sp. MC2016-14 TaxID=2897327 RepID=UPI001E2BAFB8|nr:FecR family protein [Pedobacter sp. MC2016-14]MCD0488095.1 FecR family protein [Pedobacter sp. MC2016-14]
MDNQLSAKEISEFLQTIHGISDEELLAITAEFLGIEEVPAVEAEQESLDRILLSIRTRHLSVASNAKTSFKLYPKWLAAAVVLLVPALVFLMIFRSTNNEQQIEIASGSADLKPGRSRATLKLANGTEIFLDTLRSGLNKIKQDGASISNERNGELVYIKSSETETSKIEYNTISTPKGGTYKVLLPDSTQVWLNSSSELTYPTSFAHADARVVKLEGEAFFAVKKLKDEKGKSQPFIVSTAQQQIKVLGTQFNINAYADELNLKTTLIEGSVEVNNSVKLKPGEQAISAGKEVEIRTVDVSSYIDWKNGDFNLKNNDFRTTMRKISRWYDVEIVYDPSFPQDVKLGGWISRDKNISSVLNLIQKTAKVHFKLEGRRVTVSK